MLYYFSVQPRGCKRLEGPGMTNLAIDSVLTPRLCGNSCQAWYAKLYRPDNHCRSDHKTSLLHGILSKACNGATSDGCSGSKAASIHMTCFREFENRWSKDTPPHKIVQSMVAEQYSLALKTCYMHQWIIRIFSVTNLVAVNTKLKTWPYMTCNAFMLI